MKVKAIVITDTHLNYNNVETNISIYKQAIALAKKHKRTCVYHGGDIFDARKGQTDSLLNAFEEILDMFANEGLVLVAIPGNHDKSDYKSDISYLDPYKHHPGFKLVRNGGMLDDGIFMMPYYLEDVFEEKLIERIEKSKVTGKIPFLITHIAVDGVRNNDGSVVFNNIKLNVFNKFGKVLVGHYHNKSTLGKNVHYIGSSFQHNFGEDDDKGFTLIMEDGSIEYEQAKFPEFQKIIIDVDKYSPREIDDIASNYANSENNVRFVFKGKHEKLQAIDKAKFTKLGIDIKRESDEIEAGVEEAQEGEFISFDSTSIVKEFEQFCKENKINKKEGLKYLKQTINA